MGCVFFKGSNYTSSGIVLKLHLNIAPTNPASKAPPSLEARFLARVKQCFPNGANTAMLTYKATDLAPQVQVYFCNQVVTLSSDPVNNEHH